ncbi:hypothetical protein [Paracoccus sp. KR1-242]|uniref:hypothetical protein n=1 Tax=Paracoccus sp. KR1-242 TaxID=3410028 RepID=UPI003C06FEA2
MEEPQRKGQQVLEISQRLWYARPIGRHIRSGPTDKGRKQMENPMRARIRARLDAIQKNPGEVAISAGFDRIYLYEFLEGRKKNLRWSNVPKIAKVLECDPRYLTGEIDTPWPVEGLTTTMTFGEATPPMPIRGLPVTGVISLMAWSEGDLKPPAKITVAPDIRYPEADQRAYIVMGDTWKSAGISDGSIVTVANMPPREGDLVVARVTRGNGESRIEIGRKSGDKLTLDSVAAEDWSIEMLGVVVMESRVF